MEPNKTIPLFLNERYKKLNLEQAANLENHFMDAEIKLAVWKCGGRKAPGPDGFNFNFIKANWDTIKGDVFAAVHHFEIAGTFGAGCNSSFISLIPKTKDPLLISDFRPISLIGCLYKIVSKVLTKRLKGVLEDVVSGTQKAFIQDRQITDGIMIVNEPVAWAKRIKKTNALTESGFR